MLASRATASSSALKQLIDVFRAEGLPLLGVKGHAVPLQGFNVEQQILQHAAATNSQDAVARSLEKQLDFLLSAGEAEDEDSPRHALHGWALLAQKHAATAPACTPAAAAAAVEDAALHVHRLVHGAGSAWIMDDDEDDNSAARAELCSGRLDAAAQRVAHAHPQAFAEPQPGPAALPQELRLASGEQMHALADALSRTLKFRQEPFEWMYEGFHPLLLPSLLVTRKGMSVSLAVLAIAVLRRLGLYAIPALIEPEKVDVNAFSGIGQLATAPAAPSILLTGGTAAAPATIDPARRRGQWMLEDTEAALRAPQHSWSAQTVFRLWAEHARTMVTACQRRGESDAVISWMYQHAALDPTRAEMPGFHDA